LRVDPPERDPFGSRPELALRCPRTWLAFAGVRPLVQRHQRFGANLLKLSKLRLRVKAQNSSEPNSATLVALRKKIKERPAKNARATKARGRPAPGSCNGLFSLGIPYRGSGGNSSTSPDPTNQLPTSLYGAGPPLLALPRSGHREAPLLTYNLIRVAQGIPRCKRFGAVNCLCLQQVKRISFSMRSKQASPVCGKARILWESAPNAAVLVVLEGLAELGDCSHSFQLREHERSEASSASFPSVPWDQA
jgi:hypothetical protein